MRQSRLACSFPDASTFSDATTRREDQSSNCGIDKDICPAYQSPTSHSIRLVASMSMKRKRSTGSLIQTSTFEASSPTPFASSPTRLPNFFVQSKTHESQSSPFTPKAYHHGHTQQDNHTSHTLNSRTQKRYRDGRPEESQIHGMQYSSILLLLLWQTVDTMHSLDSRKALPRTKSTPPRLTATLTTTTSSRPTPTTISVARSAAAAKINSTFFLASATDFSNTTTWYSAADTAAGCFGMRWMRWETSPRVSAWHGYFGRGHDVYGLWKTFLRYLFHCC